MFVEKIRGVRVVREVRVIDLALQSLCKKEPFNFILMMKNGKDIAPIPPRYKVRMASPQKHSSHNNYFKESCNFQSLIDKCYGCNVI